MKMMSKNKKKKNKSNYIEYYLLWKADEWWFYMKFTESGQLIFEIESFSSKKCEIPPQFTAFFEFFHFERFLKKPQK